MSRKRFGRILAMLLTLTMLLSMLPAMAAGTQAADSVYRNGNIYTVDEDFSKATALAIQGDRLVYVGDEAGVEAYIGANTKVVDLGGKTVIPGLIEGHMHINGLGEDMLVIDAFWKPKDVILAAVKAEAEKGPARRVDPGRGWLNTDVETPTTHQGGPGRVAPKQPGLPEPGRRPYVLGQLHGL